MSFSISIDKLNAAKLNAAMAWDRFPRTAKYDAVMVGSLSMGPNVLWLTEALAEVMDLRADMRVLDLGCGMALSSVFLAREFDVRVWAVDLWVRPAENWKLIREGGLEDKVFPLHGDARSLPFAEEYFDAVVSLDAYHYFGTGVEYLQDNLLPIIKPGGQLGMISPAAVATLPRPLPEGLESWFSRVNTVDWWKEHWERSPGMSVQTAEALPGGREMWIRWDQAMLMNDDDHSDELDLLKSRIGEHLGFVRMTARKDHSQC